MAVLDLGKVVPEKGVDYFTESDIQSIETDVVTDVKNTVKVSDLQNDAGYITKDNNELTYYTLATNTGSTIELSINSSTYVMTLNLKNSAGTTISTGSIDLPLETMVVGATYDSTNKKIVLTLKNGETIDVPIGDLVSGLQTEITNDNKLSSDLVDDTNHTNKFVTASDKTTWNGKQDALVSGTNIKTINNTSVLGTGNIETEIIQYTSMPTANADNLGKIVQFVGTTDSYYTNGYFYQCVSDGAITPAYSWENIEVQPSSVANVSYLIANFPSTRVESRSYIILITGSQNISSYYWDAMKNVLVSALNDSRILYPKKIYFGIYMPDMTFNTWDPYDSTSTSTQSTRYKVQKFDGQYKESSVYIFNNSGTIDFNLSYNDLTSNLSSWNVYTYGAQTIDGVKTFSTLPESSVVPTTADQLVNKSYVDSAIASAITDALGGNY